ncbi:hypothetical protein [Vibrio sagamiensis]|uniref:Uncharacterized protein n=1 Tax=Vibrio sagamiensis NBRC 104589 TaxID=1219064 RepID=A0A511QEV9_9VIBR|nr:hypothetical protein [Vibrio sagamiensis]GEM75829.1 hypothetical protein VSA01S_19410 [Vibrio sagamiensis NBRC 104589]
MFKKVLLLGVIIISCSFGALADTTYVFCATVDGNQWDWLYEDDGKYTSVEGEWGRYVFDPNPNLPPFSSFRYFDIDHDLYRTLQNRCNEKGMVAQPARNRISDWQIFRVKMKDGNVFFAEGFYTIDYDYRL